jgi:hypothetical protein
MRRLQCEYALLRRDPAGLKRANTIMRELLLLDEI